MKRFIPAAAVLALTLAACGDDDADDANAANDANNAQTTTQEVVLDFEAMVGAEPFACGDSYALGTVDTPAQIVDFKFYISEVALIDAEGTEVPLELAADGMWQNEQVALLDFEDATMGCANGTTEMNRQVKGTVPEGDYTGVAFTLGVPFEQNHQDVAAADAPLNLASMFWNWQGGYKFLRIDGSAGGGETAGGFRAHLGSTACEMPEGSMEVSKCGNPNRLRVQLQEFDHTQDRIKADAGALFIGLDMTPNMDGNSAICMSTPENMACNEVFPQLGLKFGQSPAREQAFFGKM